MSKAEVAEMSEAVDHRRPPGLSGRRGRRTREIVDAYGAKDWEGEVEAAAAERAGALGCFGPRTECPRQGHDGPAAARRAGAACAIMHSAGHMGEGATVRAAGGFGTGCKRPHPSPLPDGERALPFPKQGAARRESRAAPG